LNPAGIGDMAEGFYLGTCSQGKSYRHSSKDEVSNRRKGFSWFLFKICNQGIREISEIRVRKKSVISVRFLEPFEFFDV